MSEDRKKFDRLQASGELLGEILARVPFDGWHDRTLEHAARDLGYTHGQALMAFPAGIIDVIDFQSKQADVALIELLEETDLSAMRVRERITFAVRSRIELLNDHKEAARRTASVLALPQHAGISARMVYRTLDIIWRGIGDDSTDFNFYTKRGILAGVFSSTLLFWFNDDSDEVQATWEFLDRRIDNVMTFEKVKGRFKETMERFPSPFNILSGRKSKGSGSSR